LTYKIRILNNGEELNFNKLTREIRNWITGV
jgi:hypothetical protein